MTVRSFRTSVPKKTRGYEKCVKSKMQCVDIKLIAASDRVTVKSHRKIYIFKYFVGPNINITWF